MRPESSCCESTRPVNRRPCLAAAALGISILVRLLWALFGPDKLTLVDLHVYVDGSAQLFGGHLYDWTESSRSPQFPLPFIYPPFAALILYPLHFLPFDVVALGWLSATVAALFGVVWLSLEMLVGKDAMREPNWRTAAVGWTAAGMWLEPVRSTLDYGQVNVFLVLLVMLAARSTRWWVSGLLVGLAAGVKLTPAVTGLHFAARRQWLAAIGSAVAFAATIAVTFVLVPRATGRYFGTLPGDRRRPLPVGSVINQSLRGALGRLVGHDIGSGPLWAAAVLATALLAFFAWRALASDDRLGTLLIVQLFALLASPISWSHHWVCLIPLILWLRHGPLRATAGARLMAAYWLFVTVIGVPWMLGTLQKSMWDLSRPGYLSWLGTVYASGALALFAWMILAGRFRRVGIGRFSPARAADRSPGPAPHPVPSVRRRSASRV
ncbi:mannosyltransferase [Nocardia seriolae]|uniref:mannosyltransferase n=1 Tax=Nocardia seriolae TaxID=37332 RepID=UPI0008FF734A|nr:mannosyltransferase [Nocardia seriolae]MTJ65951.1 mannosyltransferase [Nocardia seriolae]MTJ73177.1 mannosyltransferase [Nocardia seriolae]MTJ86123.1 mannosyltransferase [Nocardia seriolae]MTK30119.1 mannosyltransferase [Nocardia seriolae]MTK43947.1 mannosyltransferase [Nocardia seriolae]